MGVAGLWRRRTQTGLTPSTNSGEDHNQIGPKQVVNRADKTRAIAADLLSSLPTGAPIDFVRQVAEPLIGRFWGALLDMPDDEAAAATVKARDTSSMLSLHPDPQARADIDAAARAYRALI